MEKSKNLLEYLKNSGHHVRSESDLPTIYSYEKTKFSPEKAVGLVIHSMLSSTPRKNFYTDGKYIYYVQGKKVDWKGLTDTQKDDIIREDLLFDILDAYPSDYKRLYGITADHLRISDFSPSFNGKGKNKLAYNKFLSMISKQVPNNLIRQDEKNRITSRIDRNYEHLSDLLSALKSDKQHDIYERLEKRLFQYGYKDDV